MMLKIDMIIEIIQIWENNIDDGNVNNDYDDEDDKVGYITDKFIPMNKGWRWWPRQKC